MNDFDINELGATPTERMLNMMARLRDKETGCPWDVEQNFATIAPYTIEEAYEVSDAIDRGDMGDLKEELGDLLLQVVFHAQMANEDDIFNFNQIADAMTEKMVRRHPHVFGDADERDVDSQIVSWEAQKAAERGEKPQARILDGVALNLPALLRAEKLQKRAARVGFDWPDVRAALEKVPEETEEILEAMDAGASQEKLHEEMGDLLFAVTNIARKLKIDPELALRDANRKFSTRFNDIEDSVKAQGKTVTDYDLDALDAFWQAAKAKGL